MTMQQQADRGETARGTRRGKTMLVKHADVLVTMDLDFEKGTAAADAAEAIKAVAKQVRERYPMIKRLFLEAGAAPAQQRWSRPDSTQASADPQ